VEEEAAEEEEADSFRRLSIMNFLGFGQSADIEIVFDGAEHKTAEVKGEDGKVEKMLLFYDGETVSGKVRPLVHQGELPLNLPQINPYPPLIFLLLSR